MAIVDSLPSILRTYPALHPTIGVPLVASSEYHRESVQTWIESLVRPPGDLAVEEVCLAGRFNWGRATGI